MPPDTGIVHQVNLEYLASVVFEKQEDGATLAYPDTLVGTDSHTTMINGLGVLGWGVGGIEAEAAMLGQPMPMLMPEVVGFKLTRPAARGRDGDRPRAHGHADAAREGRRRQVRRVLRRGAGEPAARRPRDDRQHGAGVRRDDGLLPGRRRDARLPALHRARRSRWSQLVEAYAKEQGLFRTDDTPEPVFTDTLELDLGDVEPSLAGPKRPQDRVPLAGCEGGVAQQPSSSMLAGPTTGVDQARSSTWVGEGGSAAARETSSPAPFEPCEACTHERRRRST